MDHLCAELDSQFSEHCKLAVKLLNLVPSVLRTKEVKFSDIKELCDCTKVTFPILELLSRSSMAGNGSGNPQKQNIFLRIVPTHWKCAMSYSTLTSSFFWKLHASYLLHHAFENAVLVLSCDWITTCGVAWLRNVLLHSHWCIFTMTLKLTQITLLIYFVRNILAELCFRVS